MTGSTKTAVFLVRLSVSWEAKRTSQTHVLSLSLITAQKRGKGTVTNGPRKASGGLFLSHSSKPVITTFVSALCLQEKGKADGNIDQYFSGCWEMLLGSNSNLNGSHEKDHAAYSGDDL
ncbi:hypothetical protein PAMP_007298 [Pampus punctatissimus]